MPMTAPRRAMPFLALALLVGVAPANAAPPRHDIAFMVSNLADLPTLQASARPGVEVHLLDADQDGVDQMAHVLQGRSDVDAIHVVSHGAPGQLLLGTAVLSSESLPRYGQQLAVIAQAHRPGGDVLLYGCSVAQDSLGARFLRDFSSAIKAHVGASTNVTGSARQGGDWVLESHDGVVSASMFPTDGNGYAGLLALPRVINLSDGGIHVRPGGTSYTWTYGVGAEPPAMTNYVTILDVDYHNADFPPVGPGPEDWVLTRGKFQYSTNGGGTWVDYAYPASGNTNFVTVSGKVWRFVDLLPADSTTINNLGNAWHVTTQPGQSVGGGTTIIPDLAPTDITLVAGKNYFLSDTTTGMRIADLTPVDTGSNLNGYWSIDSQSVANLFTISSTTATNSTGTLNLGTGAVPAVGSTATVTVRYRDTYQTDATGNPLAGQGITKLLTFTVMAAQSQDLAFGPDLNVSTFATNAQLNPAVTTLSNGNFVAVWQSAGQGEGAAFNGIYGQIYDASGSALGAEFPINSAADGIDEVTPAVAALAGGRFVVAYGTTTVANGRDIGYRIVEANGTVGAELLANTAAAGAQTTPTVATLTSGNFVIAWVTAPASPSDTWGAIHAQVFTAAAGAKSGGELTIDSGASDASPSIAALTNGAYVIAWGDGTLGNVNAVVSTAPATVIPVDVRGQAYSVNTNMPLAHVAALTGGGFVVAWDAYDTAFGQTDIFFQRYNNAGAAQGTLTRANNSSAVGAFKFTATVAGLSTGGFVVGWQADTGDYDLNGIFGCRFSATGVAADITDFEINQLRRGDQNSPAVTALAAGTFATVWVDNTSDSTNPGIEGRVLLPPPVPTVTGVFPNSGPTAGGTSVVITGTGFTGASSVTIGGTAATGITVVNPSSITATTPAGTAGIKNVAVTTPGGTGTGTNLFTYVGPPTVTGVTPPSGPTSGNTFITITGTNLAGTTNVTIGGAAAGLLSATATSITANTPVGTVGAKNVVVTAPGGVGTGTNLFTYVAAPLIVGVSPAAGPTAGGTTVTINGANFTGATSVTIGASVASNLVVVNASTITVTAPAGTAGAQNVVVTTPGGSGTGTGLYTYAAPPTVTGVTPNSGPAAGGTFVTITGSNFTGASLVTIGGAVATSPTVVNANTLTATAPAGTPGAQNVSVTTPGGTAVGAGLFTYVAAPSILSITPNSGPAAGGTTVTITGANFTGASLVTIGSNVASNLNVVNANTITATAPAGTPGAQNVAVTTPGGTAVGTGLFTYIAAPSILSITPGSGPAAGGTTVTITGANFTGASLVTIGSNVASNLNVVNANTITATAPVGTPGAQNVAVTTPGGTAVGTGLFTYIAAPSILSITPGSGPAEGGTTVTITGANFTNASLVTIGAAVASNLTVVNANTITATTPAGTPGAQNVAVTTPGGTATGTGIFTYIAAPSILSITPNSGPAAGGTTVTITGANFTGATSVTIGGVVASNLTVENATTITVTTPVGTPGAQNVTVTTPGGTATGTGIFTYIPAPSVVSINPASGPAAGGTTVTITGANFTGATSVTIGGAVASNLTVENATTITVTTPAGTPGAQNVAVTTPGGTATGTGIFTYISAPTVSSVSPNNGPASGGTSIIISGTDFTGATAVTVGGNAVTSLTVLDATSLSATTPAGMAGPQDVVVTTPGGAGLGAGLFTYVAAPSVSGISPSSGPTAGGTVVTLSGANLLGASSVTIGGNEALNVMVTSASTLTATTPAGLAGARDVVVTTPGGLATAAGIFTYVAPALVPTVTAIQPGTGPESGGTVVTITGTNFASPATVTVGGAAATSVAVNSSTSITATAPAGTAGAQDVVVTTGGGTGTGAGLFTYATVDAGVDVDAGLVDAGLSDDAGLLADAAVLDGAVLDAAVDADAGAADAATAMDAGTFDGGGVADAAVQPDAGTPSPDGGMTTRDAGMAGADASVPMGDGGAVVTADAGAQGGGGGGDADAPSGGCGCESSNPADVSGPAWALFAALGLLSTRKRSSTPSR